MGAGSHRRAHVPGPGAAGSHLAQQLQARRTPAPIKGGPPTFTWPIWRDPISLTATRTLLGGRPEPAPEPRPPTDPVKLTMVLYGDGGGILGEFD